MRYLNSFTTATFLEHARSNLGKLFIDCYLVLIVWGVATLKKSLLTFVIAFALSIGLTIVALIARASSLMFFENDFNGSVLANNIFSILISLVGLAVFFATYYFLANNNKVQAVKPVVIATLLGVMLGPAIFYSLNVFLYPLNSAFYLETAAGSAVTAIFQFFLPALTALLFVELREKKSNNSLIQTPTL